MFYPEAVSLARNPFRELASTAHALLAEYSLRIGAMDGSGAEQDEYR